MESLSPVTLTLQVSEDEDLEGWMHCEPGLGRQGASYNTLPYKCNTSIGAYKQIHT